MAKKNALGRGLGALIKQSETEIHESPANITNKIELGKIEVNPYQPRTNFDTNALEELVESIKQLGIIQPITVREIDDGRYQIISGERRYRASQIAGLTEIPAYVRHADDNNMLELALVENIQREDLDAVEVAISFQRLIDECQLTQENVSERVGKKRSTITNYLRLLKLPAEIQLAIRQRQISMGHARALVNIEQNEHQLQILNDIIENGLSVRQVEMAVHHINSPKPEHAVAEIQVSTPEEKQTAHETADKKLSGKANIPKTPVYKSQPGKDILIYEDLRPPIRIADNDDSQQLREQLSKYFGMKVDIRRDLTGAGRIVIPFRTDSELQYILQLAEKMHTLDDPL